MSRFQMYLLGVAFAVVGINLLGLWAVNYLQLQKVNSLMAVGQSNAQRLDQIDSTIQLTQAQPSQAPTSASPTPTNTPIPASSPTIDPQELEELKTEQSSLSKLVSSLGDSLEKVGIRLDVLESDTSSTGTGGSTVTYVAPASTVQSEQTVFIGTGSSSSTSWTDVPTASIELNKANYPGFDHAVFEATISIIGGNGYARLKNKTTGQVITPSEVSHNSSTSTVKLSGNFGLDSGSNVYIVQLRSSSSESVVLDGARLRLFFK